MMAKACEQHRTANKSNTAHGHANLHFFVGLLEALFSLCIVLVVAFALLRGGTNELFVDFLANVAPLVRRAVRTLLALMRLDFLRLSQKQGQKHTR
jgi:hypothetical protein